MVELNKQLDIIYSQLDDKGEASDESVNKLEEILNELGLIQGL